LRDNWKAVRASDAQVLGINPQSARSHRSFRERYKFPFPLLVDSGQKVAALYHANGLIVKRTVYLIDGEGVIRFARRGMPKPSEVLAAAK
jgi:peroxiredoxin Q/BCP